MNTLAENLARVRGRIAAACQAAGRHPDSVTLIAVSKGHPVSALEEFARLGITAFGESYVQEWKEKAAALPGVDWHFIGHLQSKKAKLLVGRTALIQSVDRINLMEAIQKRATAPVDVLLQVNVGEDPAKFGAAPDAFIPVLQTAISHDKINVRGLMTIPPFTSDPEDARPHFRALAQTLTTAKTWLQEHAPEKAAQFTELSMGMTADLEVAIAEGATMIRIGTALFGPRN